MENKIPYHVIKQITNNYDETRKLGTGGFGTVYKGVQENGETIAVKVFDLRFDDREFQKEFDNLKRLRHDNIVELVGFCNDTEEVLANDNGKLVPAIKLHMAICLEYVQNGHLGSHISDESTGLHWYTRYNIIKGVCKGLKYLHEEIDPPILHLDLKPQNILLDKDMTPKVADFGLSRLFGEKKTAKTSSACGTIGYIPPEYTDFQVISEKFDIYSLGVIMVKIITGHDRFFRLGDMSRRVFINQVHDNWKKRLGKVLSSGSLQVHCQQVKKCIELALDCVRKNRQERPTMHDVFSKLIETETMIGKLGMNIEQLLRDEPIHPRRDIPENPSPEKNNGPLIRGTYQYIPPAIIPGLPHHLPFDFFKKITDDFSDGRELGEHPFGKVYKGIIPDFGDVVIAVVKFWPDSPFGRDSEFPDKIRSLLEVLDHENIVKILGYCREKIKRLVQFNGKYIQADIPEALLCHEYFAAGSLAEYIDGESCRVDWNISFGVIMGICQGMHFLHTELHVPYIHTDLRPQNIFLDNQMVPKIIFFGQSKEEITPIGIPDVVGPSNAYVAPEYLYSGEISTRIDIYSLGIIILEIIAGGREHRIVDHTGATRFIENVRDKWTDEYIISMYPSLDKHHIRHVKICIETGLKCVEQDQRNRPSIVEIVHRLNILSREELIKHELLEVHPRELCFPFEQKKPIMCSLQLRNTGDNNVAFMLVSESPNRYITKLPLCGILPHRCTYTHTITMHKQKQHLPTDGGEFFTLHTVAVGKYDLQDVDKGSIDKEYRDFFNKAQEVQVVTLTVTCDPPVNQEPIRSTIEIITRANAQQVSSIDVHPTEPWIMIASKGSIHVWNYKTMKNLSLFEEDIDGSVYVAKFLEREKWIVAGDANGGIHVYSYAKRDDVKFFRAHNSRITSLALHPTRPILLSSSEDADNLIKLWDWDKSWEDKTFSGHADKIMQVAFHSDNSGCFTSASLDGTVKIWSIDSGDADITLDDKYASLLCFESFKRSNRQHLIAGSMDGTAQIWNMETKGDGCVHRLEGHRGRISAINLHPELPMLITGSFDGTVRLWNSDTYKLDEIINFNLGQVYAFGFIKDPRRIVVGCEQGIAMLEISTC